MEWTKLERNFEISSPSSKYKSKQWAEFAFAKLCWLWLPRRFVFIIRCNGVNWKLTLQNEAMTSAEGKFITIAAYLYLFFLACLLHWEQNILRGCSFRPRFNLSIVSNLSAILCFQIKFKSIGGYLLKVNAFIHRLANHLLTTPMTIDSDRGLGTDIPCAFSARTTKK